MPYVKGVGGICPFCNMRVQTLEDHHVCYDPERKVKMCHKCHFYYHHMPWMLSAAAQILLKKLRGEDCKRWK